jgi:murein DD-endopeptidase MepM/ murein hydrolase activator NlpD
MRSWTPKSRNYWGQKKRNDSSDSDQEESDSNNDRPPMPWEPQDTTEYDKLYWEGEDSDEIDLDNETVIPTTEIIENRPKPKKRQSLIEDIDPKNFLEKIIRGMIKGKGSDSTPKVIGKNAVMGPEDYKASPTFKGKTKYFGEGLFSQLPNKLSHQNKVWPSGYIYPIPDSFKIYKTDGRDFKPGHNGIDIVGKSKDTIRGQPILSVCDGEIVRLVTTDNFDKNPGGIRVRIKDSNGLHNSYFHMLPESNDHLKNIKKVYQGQVIGFVGSSGNGNFDDRYPEDRKDGTGTHLHFEMWKNDNPVEVVDYRIYFPELSSIPNQSD